MGLRLQNIYNNRRTIYLFCRDEKSNQIIRKDTTFYPYYYEPDQEGKFKSYDGVPLRKVFCSEPKQVGQQRSLNSYEADILFTKRYIIDKIDKFEKGPIKYLFIDIEVLSDEFPDQKEAKYPIVCITVYNSLYQSIRTWWIKQYKDEKIMLKNFVEYIQLEKPDLILAWNINFDYTYLYNRIENFASKISPIKSIRYGEEKLLYPAGISILDYLSLFKKVNPREKSYALDYIAQEHLDEKSWGRGDFSELNEDIRKKNINDVNRMIKLEKKYKILDYYNEIRLFTKCLWEDVLYNSRIIDMIILQEAKKREVILPNRSKSNEAETFQGAYRRAETGRFFDIYKADVASMYPNQLINFCLDPINISTKKTKDAILIDNTLFIQNQNAILPTLAKQLIKQKDKIKKELKLIKADNPIKSIIQNKYDAYKALVNSLFGVTAFPSFRLYNNLVASSIAFLARDLLQYVEQKIQKQGYKVIYTDTDALIYKADEDKIDLLNSLVKEWAIEKYNNPNINIEFESEGKFTKLLILGKCHYYGYINKNLSIQEEPEEEIKGIEVKRSSSSVFEAEFQKSLIEHILNKEDKETIINWIKKERERIKSLSLEEIAFPCKIANKKYKNEPIFVRAYKITQEHFPNFKINKGELFYYIYILPSGNVYAFTSNNKDHIERDKIDWNEIIRRNIIGKADTIFSVMKWDIKTALSGQLTLF